MMRFTALLLIVLIGCQAAEVAIPRGDFTSKIAHVVAMQRVTVVPNVAPDVLPAGVCSNCKGKGRLGDGTVSTICPVCKGTGKTGTAQDENQYGAIGDGMVDRARDRAIIKAGLTWEKIQFIAAEAFAWALKSKAIRTAVESPSQSYAMAPEIQPISQYKAAYDSAKESGKPLIVLITADWCKWCHKLERDSIAPLRANGELDDCEFIVLDLDQDKEAKQIVGDNPIPVLMRYQFTNGKWQASKMAGYKPKDEVRAFLKGVK